MHQFLLISCDISPYSVSVGDREGNLILIECKEVYEEGREDGHHVVHLVTTERL